MRGNKVLNHFIFVFLPIDDNLNVANMNLEVLLWFYWAFDISFYKRKTQQTK